MVEIRRVIAGFWPRWYLLSGPITGDCVVGAERVESTVRWVGRSDADAVWADGIDPNSLELVYRLPYNTCFRAMSKPRASWE